MYKCIIVIFIFLVLPTPVNFTAKPLNSSTVRLIINNHVEDKRYHVGFLVHITSYYVVNSSSFHHTFWKYFYTGQLHPYLVNLSPYKKYEITLWSLTHQGFGPRGKRITYTHIDGMSLFMFHGKIWFCCFVILLIFDILIA